LLEWLLYKQEKKAENHLELSNGNFLIPSNGFGFPIGKEFIQLPNVHNTKYQMCGIVQGVKRIVHFEINF